jgi:homoserine acetyltransferase
MAYETNRNRWMYPFLRTQKTERTIQKMIQEDQMPYVQFHEEFINIDIETLSKYKTEYIEEFFRTSQILLFESFQQNMNTWLEVCRQKKQEAKDLKERNKVVRFREKRETEYNRAQTIDTDRLFPPRLQVEIADLVPQAKKLVTISSDFGHDGFLVESEAMTAAIRGII